jgi:two-component system response regulator AtoC
VEESNQILYVDNQEKVLDYITNSLDAAGFRVTSCSNIDQAKLMLEKRQIRPELILIDPAARNGSQATLKEICDQVPTIPVIAISSSSDPQSIVQAIRDGASDYFCKPLNANELALLVKKVFSSGSTSLSRTHTPSSSFQFICHSQAMKEVQKTALRVAKTNVPVLITGETGVGKDIIARFIHQESELAENPFVKVNCAAMPTELVESELFGYRKGAFTGAFIDRPGKFEFANKGTIFLDEIAEFTPSVQAKLLQVLQDGYFSRLGGNEDVFIEVRVVAATNQSLETAIKEDKFREDLYYRLNVVNINICPLRHRKEEIPVFSEFFLEKFTQQYGSEMKEIPSSLLEVMMAYHWPGNVRELENLVKRFAVLQDPDSIIEELTRKMSEAQNEELEEMANNYFNGDEELDLKEISKRAVSQVEKNVILKSLRKHKWNKSKAARELKVTYKTLLTKIDQYRLEP